MFNVKPFDLIKYIKIQFVSRTVKQNGLSSDFVTPFSAIILRLTQFRDDIYLVLSSTIIAINSSSLRVATILDKQQLNKVMSYTYPVFKIFLYL